MTLAKNSQWITIFCSIFATNNSSCTCRDFSAVYLCGFLVL